METQIKGPKPSQEVTRGKGVPLTMVRVKGGGCALSHPATSKLNRWHIAGGQLGHVYQNP